MKPLIYSEHCLHYFYYFVVKTGACIFIGEFVSQEY